MKTKIKSYDDEATDFYDKQVSKADSDMFSSNHCFFCSLKR